jgi:hypothetical protein
MAGGNKVALRALWLLLFAMLAPLALGTTAFAQAGSTGGTIGKTDKSVSGQEAEQPRHKRPNSASARQKLFVNPTIDGIRVDRCWHYGTGCDERAATEWCRSKGLARATEWKWEYISATIGQSDGHRCSTVCGGFSKISCE